MATRDRKIPRSYDEILRRTVVDPDSSFRPSEHQVAEADEQFRHDRLRAQMTDQERVLYANVAEVVLGAAHVEEIGFEIDRGTVILHGSVRDPAALVRIEDRVRAIDGVEEVVNRIVVGR
jgi:hypothetical protein